ncbi:ABC transporter substrate-binding protein [Erwinia sp. INIA-01]|uniref:ABC transporter substrate-binding protein n=1 Tax=Erwinia sp. INIA01 TaxID=2991500 RepID=UPI0022254368|nr:ABC transporter substrate-binding protein [Erwinia sp. INIA01]MCW1873462.1 ABC transporter substrate-binding protein [Erwinia sp. INIA01]
MPLPRFTRNILATSLLLAASGTFAADTVSTGIPVTDSINTQTLNKNPQNVVVYDLAMLDILDVLGVKVSGLPLPKEKGSYPAYLSKYESDSYYNVGNPFKPDFEVLKQHKPDLIIGGSRAFESTDKLRAVAPTLDLTVDNAHLLSSLEDRTRTLGKLFDKQQQAEQALASFNKDIQKNAPAGGKSRHRDDRPGDGR